MVTGLIGSPEHQELTVIGSHVNLASRVESYSMRGQVLISSNTLARCTDAVSIGSVYDVQPKGNHQAIKIHELLSINTPSLLQVPRISQRRHVRADIQLSLKFNIVEDKHLSNDLYDGTTVDISYTGIGIITTQPLSILTEIRIILSMSLLSPQIREVYAKVTRLRVENGQYHAGLEFTSIDDHSLESIKTYIDSQMTHN